MADPTDLARVLAALDAGAIHDEGAAQRRCADAARLLRALRADFNEFARHDEECEQGPFGAGVAACICGLDAARARWRLDEEGEGKT